MDLRPGFESDENISGNDTLFPFHTYEITGEITFNTEHVHPLGLYNYIGWEVAGDFQGKVKGPQEFEFVREPFNPLTASLNDDGELLVTCDGGTGAYILAAYVYREENVRWLDTEFTVWENSGEIEIPIPGMDTFVTAEGTRLRLQGGESLGWRDADGDAVALGSEDDDHHPDVTASYIRSQALVSLLRGVPDVIVGEDGTPVRREWEIRAVREMEQLPRMQAVRYL